MTKKVVKIFSTPGCSSCARAKELLDKIIGDYPGVKIKEINILDHPEDAIKYGIMSSPTTVINEKVEFIGVPSEKNLRKILEKLK